HPGRRAGDRQQRFGTDGQDPGDRPQELALRRQPNRWPAGGHPAEPRRQRQGQPGGAVGLSQEPVYAARRTPPIIRTTARSTAARSLADRKPPAPLAHRYAPRGRAQTLARSAHRQAPPSEEMSSGGVVGRTVTVATVGTGPLLGRKLIDFLLTRQFGRQVA